MQRIFSLLSSPTNFRSDDNEDICLNSCSSGVQQLYELIFIYYPDGWLKSILRPKIVCFAPVEAVVSPGGFEPPTCGLRGRRSTTELRAHVGLHILPESTGNLKKLRLFD